MNPKIRILVVEDNQADVDFIQEMLPATGPVSFHLESVARLADGITRLAANEIDLVLLDLGLPDSQGLDTFHKLRQAVPEVPVIVLSGANDEELAAAAVAAGAQDYLVKGLVSGSLLARAARYAIARHQAELALAGERALLRNLVDNLPLTIYLKDSAGRKTLVNPLGLRNHDVAAEAEVLGKTDFDFFPPEQAAAFAADDQRVLAGQPVLNREEKLTRPDGTSLWLLTSKVPLRDAAGRVTGLVGMGLDITERQRAEAALNASEVRYRRLFEAARDGILILDAETGMVVEVNPFLIELLGYSREAFLGKKVWELGFFKDIVANQDNFQELQQKEYIRYEGLALETAVGRRIEVEFVSNVYLVKGQKVIQCNIRDISERVRTEETFNKFFEQPLALNLIAKFDGVIHRVNQGMEDLLGYGRGHLAGVNFLDLVHPDDQTATIAEMGKLAQGINTFYFENRYRQKSGGFRLLAWSASVSTADRMIFAVATDITERKRAEEKLRTSEAEFRMLAESMPQMVWATRPDGWNIYFSQQWMDYTGLTLEESLGHGWNKPFHPDDRQRAWNAWQHATTTISTYSLECRLRRADGEYRWWLIRGVPQLDAAGKVLKWFGTCTDIHKSKLEEELLRESEAMLQEAQRIASLGSFALDIASGLWSSSPVLDDLFGIDAGYERSVAGWLALVHPGDHTMMVDYFEQEVLGQHQPFNKEYRILRHKDQSERWVHGLGKLEFDAASRPVKLVGTIQDITGRRRMEESHARLAMAVEQSAESVVITDTDAKILYVNPAFEKTSGYARAEVLGQNPRILKSGKHDSAFYQQMWDVLKRGEVWAGHFINKRRDGRLFEEEATISPLRDATGKVVNYVAAKRDMTREMQLDAQFRQSQKMEAVGQLAGGVAHDFNNILAVISMQADLLKSGGDLSPAQSDLAGDIGVAVQRAVTLTRQLLMFSRKQVLQPRDLDLNHSVAEMTKMLTRLLGENIAVQCKLATQPMLLHADAGMLDQVLMNLCVNARDAMPDGGRLVIETAGVEFDAFAATQTAQARPGAFVCLSVSDNGCGIPPENLARIFDPFFTTKGVGKGTGLGLATVYGIAQQHQGWVNVFSEVGHGTTFKIYLPRLAERHDTKIIKKPPATAPTGQETILLVEDEPPLRFMLGKSLTRLGYRVLEAGTGVKALEVWKEHHGGIHLLLTDLMMPDGMTGKELGQQLLEGNPKLKVIYMSGYSPDIVGKDFPLAEGVNFLTKPFPAQRLAQTIRAVLDDPAGDNR